MMRSSKITLALEWAALACGAALLLAYVAAQWHFSRMHDSGLEQFELELAASQQRTATEEAVDARATEWQATSRMELEPGPVDIAPLELETTASLHAGSPDMTSWAPTRISAYRAETRTGSPRGVLRIASIGMEVPVYERLTESNLNRGAAWIDGTAPLGSIGNIGLAAHRDGYFRALRDIAIGDRIELQTLQGAQAYTVEAIRIVAPDEVQVLAPTMGEQLTLVTCYPFYKVGPAPKRFVVQARPSGIQADSRAYRRADAGSKITPHANRAPESPDG